jgi:quercetin dioxygenase-like cupin family protein
MVWRDIMKNFGRVAGAVVAMGLVGLLGGTQALGQDPVKVAPDVFKVLLDDPHVRVLEVSIAPGFKVPPHAIAEHVGYVLEAGTIKFTHADGKTEDMECKTGEVKFGPAATHSAENVGKTRVRGVLVELKGTGPAAGKGALGVSADKDPVKVCPDITKVLFENDRVRVTETNLKAGAKMPMHSHPPYVIYALTAAKVKSTTEDGKSREIDVALGSAEWGDAVTHTIENIGTSDSRVLNFELKHTAGAHDGHGH